MGVPRHGLYPPGYPALLSIWGLLTGDTFTGAVVLGILLNLNYTRLRERFVRRSRADEPRPAAGAA